MDDVARPPFVIQSAKEEYLEADCVLGFGKTWDLPPLGDRGQRWSTSTSIMHKCALLSFIRAAKVWCAGVGGIRMRSGPSVVHGPVVWPGRLSAHSLNPYHGRGAACGCDLGSDDVPSALFIDIHSGSCPVPHGSACLPNEVRRMHQLSTFRIRPRRAAEGRSTGGCVVVFPALRPATGTFVDHRWCLSSSSNVFMSCWPAHPLYPAPDPLCQPNIPLVLMSVSAHFLTAS